MAKKKYTKESLIEIGKQMGDILSVRSWKELKGMPNISTIFRHFGTWNNFKTTCGFEINKKFFMGMSDDEVLTYTRDNHHGKAINELHSSERRLESTLRKRGLIDSLVAEGVLIRKKNKCLFSVENSDEEIIDYVRQYYGGWEIAKFNTRCCTLSNIIRERGILDNLVEQGILKRMRTQNGFFKKMSDDDMISYVRARHHKSSVTGLYDADSSLYGHILSRGLMSRLVEEGVLFRKNNPKGFFDQMSDEELSQLVEREHNGENISRFSRDQHTVYKAVLKKGILPLLVAKGILKSAKVPDGYWKEFTNIESGLWEIINRIGRFPKKFDFIALGNWSLYGGIQKYPGGLLAVKQRMGYGATVPEELEQEFAFNIESDAQALEILKHFSYDPKDAADILMALNPEKFRQNTYRILSLGQYLGRFKSSGGGVPHTPDEFLHDLESIIDKNELVKSVILRKAFQLFEQRYLQDRQGTLGELTEKVIQTEGTLKGVYQEILCELKEISNYVIPGVKRT